MLISAKVGHSGLLLCEVTNSGRVQTHVKFHVTGLRNVRHEADPRNFARSEFLR